MNYPSVFRRYLATLLDLTVLWVGVYTLTRVPQLSESAWAMPVLAITLVLLYEPLLTSYLCTAGQALMGIRVRTYGSLKHIGLSTAYSRLFTKYLLGVISLLTIPARGDRRAIHDLLTETIMVDARTGIPSRRLQNAPAA